MIKKNNNIISLTWLKKHGHALLNRGEETIPWRTKTKELADSSFNAFLMLPPTHHHPPPLWYSYCFCWRHRAKLGVPEGVC